MSQFIENSFNNANFHGNFNQNNFNTRRDIRALTEAELQQELQHRKARIAATRRIATREAITIFTVGIILFLTSIFSFKFSNYENMSQLAAALLEGAAGNAVYETLCRVIALLFGTAMTISSGNLRFRNPEIAKEKRGLKLVKSELARERLTEKRKWL